MAKIKSFITEAEVTFMKDVEVEFVSLVGHAANRQPFKIIKGEVIKGDNVMPKKTIYSVLVPTDIVEEKFKEIVETHNFSIEEKVEDQLDGYTVYKQISDDEVDLGTKKMAQLQDGAFVIVADLKEESEKEGLEKDEFEYESLDKVADSLFAMMDIVLGVMRQPEAEGASRKDMVMTAVSNFSKYVNTVLSEVKAEDILGEIEIKSDIIKEFMPEEIDKISVFDLNVFESRIKEDVRTEFNAALAEKVNEVLAKFEEAKQTLNASINEHFENYSRKEDLEKEIVAVKGEIETIKNTAKTRNSVIDDPGTAAKQKSVVKKQRQFTTFI